MIPPKPCTGRELWEDLDGKRSTIASRAQVCAQLTSRKLLNPEGQDPDVVSAVHGFQSLGAVCVSHLASRYTNTLLPPGEPFVRIKPKPALLQELAAEGMDQPAVEAAIAVKEREACAEVDQTDLRIRVLRGMRHIIVTGNVCIRLPESDVPSRVWGVSHFGIQRDAEGGILRACIREKHQFRALSPAAQEAALAAGGKFNPKQDVFHFQVLEAEGNRIVLRQFVDDTVLPPQFNGSWTKEECPWLFPTWDRADQADYGNGLVEEYERDFLALEVLSGALMDGGAAAADVRWLLNTSGGTRVQDVENGKRGGVVPGRAGDLSLLHAGPGLARALEVILEAAAVYEKRINEGFLRIIGMTRTAERVTATEIRRDAQELETGHVGQYSALGQQIQKPIALWGLRRIGTQIAGKDADISVVTGLDAMSRQAELNSYDAVMQRMGALNGLPAIAQQELSFSRIMAFLGSRQGISVEQFFLNAEERAQQAELLAAQQGQQPPTA